MVWWTLSERCSVASIYIDERAGYSGIAFLSRVVLGLFVAIFLVRLTTLCPSNEPEFVCLFGWTLEDFDLRCGCGNEGGLVWQHRSILINGMRMQGLNESRVTNLAASACRSPWMPPWKFYFVSVVIQLIAYYFAFVAWQFCYADTLACYGNVTTSAMNVSMELDFGGQEVGRSVEPRGISQQMDFSRVCSLALGFGRDMEELDVHLHMAYG